MKGKILNNRSKENPKPQKYTLKSNYSKSAAGRMNIHRNSGLELDESHYQIVIPGLGLLIIPVENLAKIELVD